MKNKYLGFILSVEDCEKFIKPNKELINELSKNFEKIYVINVLNLRSRVKKCKTINEQFFHQILSVLILILQNNF